MTLGLHYDTSPEKIDQFCDALTYYLQNDSEIDPISIQVYFKAFNDSTLDIHLQYFIKTSLLDEEIEGTHRVNLEIWKVAQKLGIVFAYPTRTIYSESGSPEPANPTKFQAPL
jgi:MscS family membrane protein